MTTINMLSQLDTVSSGDQVPIFSTSQGDTRKASISALATAMQSILTTSDDGFTPQYFAPTATGFSVNINDANYNTWLILTPTATFANGTIKLPTSTIAIHNQELLITTTQTITTLTINTNGASAVGLPATLAAGGFFRIKFEGVADVWYRVG